MKIRLSVMLLSATMLFCTYEKSYSQDARELSSLIKHADSLFWDAYNCCDEEGMLAFVSSDIEFYHDRGGYTVGLPAFIESLRAGMCRSDRNYSLMRIALEETIEVFPLEKDGQFYGAIISGEHEFCIVEPGKSPRLDGHARFTHLWMRRDGSWKMTRVLSFDHGPAVYKNTRQQIDIPASVLTRYVGKYLGPVNGELVMKTGDGTLVMSIGSKDFTIYPCTETMFFMKERDLTFEFVKDSASYKLIVRESGDVAEELQVLK